VFAALPFGTSLAPAPIITKEDDNQAGRNHPVRDHQEAKRIDYGDGSHQKKKKTK